MRNEPVRSNDGSNTQDPPQPKTIDLTPNLDKWRVVPTHAQSQSPQPGKSNVRRWAKPEYSSSSQTEIPRRVASIRDRQRPSVQTSRSENNAHYRRGLDSSERMSKWAPDFPTVPGSPSTPTDASRLRSRGAYAAPRSDPRSQQISPERRTDPSRRTRQGFGATNGHLSNKADFTDHSFPSLSYEEERSNAHNRSTKDRYKSRGSIVSRLDRGKDAEIPLHSRVTKDRIDSSAKEKRMKLKLLKKANMDVYIPNVITVGNLARLLNVRQGAVVVIFDLE